MRFLVCCLCTDDEPFVCPFRFRRSYMLLHLEKAHNLAVDNLQFVRRVDPADQRVVWMAVHNREASRTLTEVEVSLDGEARHAKAQVVNSDRVARDQQQVHQSSWTPAALQSLYRDRGGRQPA